MSLVYYFSEWSQGSSCNGPPTSMYVIEAEDAGPASFQWATSQLNLDTCGYSAVKISAGCCMGSYDLDSSISGSVMSSGLPVLRSDEAFITWTPTTAVGSKYCAATYITTDGYPLTKYLLDDGVCRESWQCDEGVLKVSNSTEECMGSFHEVISNAKFSEVLNSTVALAYTTIESAFQATVWNGYYPFSLNIIYLDTATSIFGCVVLVAFMLSSVFAAVFIIHQLRQHPQQKQVYLPILMSQVVTIFASLSTTIFYFFPLPNDTQFLIMKEITAALQIFSSFLISWNNLKILLAVLNKTTYTSFLKGREHFCYIALGIVHLTLAWTWYFSFMIFKSAFIRSWYIAGTLWIGVSLIGNFLCLVLFVSYQLNAANKRSSFDITSTTKLVLMMISQNIHQFNLLLLLSLNIIWFIVSYSLVSGLVLQNDLLLHFFELSLWITVPFNGYISVILFGWTSKQMKSVFRGTNTNTSEKQVVQGSLAKLENGALAKHSRTRSNIHSSVQDVREANVVASTNNLADTVNIEHRPLQAREKIGLEKLTMKSTSTPDLINSNSIISRSRSHNELDRVDNVEKRLKVELADKGKQPRIQSVQSINLGRAVSQKQVGAITSVVEPHRALSQKQGGPTNALSEPHRALSQKQVGPTNALLEPHRALSINSKATIKSFKETGVQYSGLGMESPKPSKKGRFRSLSGDYLNQKGKS